MNGSITPTGTTSVFEGYNQTYTITPSAGFTVATLTVDGAPATASTTYMFINVTAPHTIDVTFSALPTHDIVSSAGANGSISPLGTTTVFEGSSQTYTITPGAGFTVATLTIDGATTTASTTYTFVNVLAPHTIMATFSALPTHDIVAIAGVNGTITPVGTTTVFEGSSQTYTITPSVGFGVASLTVDGVSTTSSTTYTFANVTASHTISATFSALPTHTIVSSAGANGSVSPLGTTTVLEGSNQAYSISPSGGYAIATLTVDGVVTTPSSTYTFSNVLVDHTISATFSPLPPSGGGGGSGGGSSSKKKTALSEQALLDSLMKTLNELKLKVAFLIAKRDAEKLASLIVVEKQKEIALKKAEAIKKEINEVEKEVLPLETIKINKEMETLVTPALKETFTPGVTGKKREAQSTTSEAEGPHTSSTGEVIYYEVKSFFSVFIVGFISTIVGFFSAF